MVLDSLAIWSGNEYSDTTHFGNASLSENRCCRLSENILQPLLIFWQLSLRLVALNHCRGQTQVVPKDSPSSAAFSPSNLEQEQRLGIDKIMKDDIERSKLLLPIVSIDGSMAVPSRDLFIVMYRRPLHSCVPGSRMYWRCALRPH